MSLITGKYVRRPTKALVRKVKQMEDSLIKRGRGKPKKTIGETIKEDHDLNGFIDNLVFESM